MEHTPHNNLPEKTSAQDLIKTLLATITIAGAAIAPTESEARIGASNTFSSSEDSPYFDEHLSSLTKQYEAAGLGRLNIEASSRFGTRITILDNNTPLISYNVAVKNYKEADLSPERIRLELEQKRNPSQNIRETVKGTDIFISGYAEALMKHLGIKYNQGIMTFTSNGIQTEIPLANAGPGVPTNITNTAVEIRGFNLQQKLLACVKDMQKISLYYLDKGGKKIELSEESNIEVVAKSCR